MSRIILTTPDEQFEHRVRIAFDSTLDGDLRRIDPAELRGDAAAVADALVRDGLPDVVAIGPDVDTDAAFKLAEQLDLSHPQVSVLLVVEPSGEVFEQALRLGIRDIVRPDAPPEQLREALQRAQDSALRRREALLEESDETTGARILTVISPKGGSGKTTIATNLAVALAGHAPGQTLLIDADTQFGDVSNALQLRPEHTLVDATRMNGSLDAMAAKVLMTSHPAELYTLCAPEDPVEGDEITGAQLSRILETIRSEFRYVLVDTAAGLTEQALAAIEAATDLVMVCSNDVPSVRALKKELDTLERLGITSARRHLVLNRADSKVGLSADDIEATLGHQVDIAVPSHRSVPLSMNQGLPLTFTDSRNPVSRQVQALASRFVEQPATSGSSQGLLSWRRGR